MHLDLFVIAFLSVFHWPDILIGVTGGFLLGIAMSVILYDGRADAIEIFVRGAGIIAFLGFVFFLGQFFSTFAREGEAFAWRVFWRCGIWLLFSVGLGLGAAVYTRGKQGRWRERRHGLRRYNLD